ncbi:D-tyrosyl-tRNA(Tyr) deacylase [Thermodesulfobacterium sp. TA1]|uniref:D-aminoacyl-tRNA deacylase n=1 Tax=Thermodesulfobacterium sp. TA1 TaxID=2234087 RepID=UPI001232BFF5|nr:D-aminoacyl-tRNA deacylase [Thermodesulfobacterium sp. TA1]QER41790.1 D-tyrosyl-tRNA(Tyr) deacylase [Thermodesulfobacterium sp. TA1]
MKAVIQRVKEASVSVEGKIVSQINQGLLVLACVEKGDDEKIVDWMADKVINLRIFPDQQGKFNLSLKDLNGEILLISNFTVCGHLKKGTRPSFHLAEEPTKAEATLRLLAEKIRQKGLMVKEGIFGAHMEIFLVNDGPVTIVLEKTKPSKEG